VGQADPFGLTRTAGGVDEKSGQPNEDDDFSVRDLTEMMSGREASANVMSLLLGSIASISLIVGGMIIISLKHKYQRIYLTEAVGSFALYAVLVALFTSPVVDALRTMVS
jgi:hypothetical protein